MFTKTLVAVLAVCVMAGCGLTQGFGAKAGKLPDNAGILAIKCNVKGADVYVDKRVVGTITKADSRQDFTVIAGEHDLQIKKFGYQDFSAQTILVQGAVNTLDVSLERVPTKAVTVPLDKATEAGTGGANAAK
jgi:hypothetical protein